MPDFEEISQVKLNVVKESRLAPKQENKLDPSIINRHLKVFEVTSMSTPSVVASPSVVSKVDVHCPLTVNDVSIPSVNEDNAPFMKDTLVNDTVLTVRTDVFARGLNKSCLMSTPLNPFEKKTRNFLAPPSPPKRITRRSSLMKPIAVLMDPKLNQFMASSPLNSCKKVNGFKDLLDVSAIPRSKSRSNHIFSRTKMTPHFSSSHPGSASCTPPLNDSTQPQETTVVRAGTSTRVPSVGPSIEHFDIPFMSQLNANRSGHLSRTNKNPSVSASSFNESSGEQVTVVGQTAFTSGIPSRIPSIEDIEPFYLSQHNATFFGKSCRRITQVSNFYVKEQVVTNVQNIPDVLKSFSAFAPTTVILENGLISQLSSKEKVLALCQPQEVTDFDQVFTKEIMKGIRKVNEGSYGEIYMTESPEGHDVVIKIIPFPFEASEEEMFAQLLPEVMICSTFRRLRDLSSRNQSPNFIDMTRASCVEGEFPRKLVNLWLRFKKEKGSENLDPRHYKEDHKHIVMFLNNGGTDIENYQFTSAQESLSVFFQVTLSLAAAEDEFEFEHRDLHWGNVLVASSSQDCLRYSVGGVKYEVPTSGVNVSIIDFSLSRMTSDGFIVHDDLSKQDDIFTGDAEEDYQFEVYRKMRLHNDNDWEKFCPKTNIFWLHYLLDKLMRFKKYKTTSRNKLHKKSMDRLKQLHEKIEDFSSSKEFVESLFFQDMISD